LGIARDTEEFWKRKRRHSYHYNFKRFLEGYLLSEPNNRRASHRFSTLRQVLEKASAQERVQSAGIQLLDKNAKGWTADVPAFHKELSALSSQSAFTRFNPKAFRAPGEGSCTVEDVSNTDWIENSLQEAWPQIQAKCPGLAKFLSEALSNQRSGWKSYNTDSKTHLPFPVARAYMIAALFMGSYAAQSNFLSVSIGIYLLRNGVQKRVINTLAQFGVSASHSVVAGQLDLMTKQLLVGLPSQDPVQGEGSTDNIVES
jgi:hypothetical protein